jgi:hypothetical protein
MGHVKRAISAISNRHRLIQVCLGFIKSEAGSAGTREPAMRYTFATVMCRGFLLSGCQLSKTFLVVA